MIEAICDKLLGLLGPETVSCEGFFSADIDKVASQKWDVILLDPFFVPELGPVVATILDANPDTAIVAMATQPNRELVTFCIELGIKAVISRRIDAGALARVIRIALAGGSYIERGLGRDLTGVVRPTEGRSLTQREELVLRRWAQGYSNSEIARQAELSPKTVDTYRKRGLDKMGLSDRPSLIRMASARGWLTED